MLPSLFVLVNVGYKITISRECRLEMIGKWAQERPAGPVHICLCLDMHTLLQTPALSPMGQKWSVARLLKIKEARRGKGWWANRLSWCSYWCLEAENSVWAFTHVQRIGRRSPFEMLRLSSSLPGDQWAQAAFSVTRQLQLPVHNQMGSFVCMVCGFDLGFAAWFIFIVITTGHAQPPFVTFPVSLAILATGSSFTGQKPNG